MVKWRGQTEANVLGLKIFVFILNLFGLRPAYFILRFVALYYFLFKIKSNKIVYYYFHDVLKYKPLKAYFSIYRNYYVFGQTLLDKIALLSGVKNKFTIDHDGGSNLDKLAEVGKGGILLSAHVGNWEIAVQLLNRLNTTFNLLLYENERENIKKYMEGVLTKKNVNIIAIKEGEMGHVIELNNAFKNNELVVFAGDRFRDGAPTLEAKFLGKIAKFPAGPFILSVRFGVPISVVFAVKETQTHYHFFASDPIEIKRGRTEGEIKDGVQKLLERYIEEFEKMVVAYPEQWFNYFPFWKEQDKD